MSESTLKRLSLLKGRRRKGRKEGELGHLDQDLEDALRVPEVDEEKDEDAASKEEDEKKKEEEEDEFGGEETEEEKKARKEREMEEMREWEEAERADRAWRALQEKKSVAAAAKVICCSEECGRGHAFHPCSCLAPVRQDPVPYEDMLAKRKLQHPEWYKDPYGLEDDDMANKILRMLMGELTEEEAAAMVQNVMGEDERKEEEENLLETPTGSPPGPLSRASSAGDYEFSEDGKDSQDEEEEEEDEYEWPTCREFTAQEGGKSIEEFIAERWQLPPYYKFCVDFLGSVGGPPEQIVKDYYYRAKFSVPTRLEPIPLQRAAVHFIISVMLNHDRPRDEKVYVGYYLESKRTRFAAETPFKIEWLEMIMANKHRLADDWGRKKTNLYQFVLDGAEGRAARLAAPKSEKKDNKRYWIPIYD